MIEYAALLGPLKDGLVWLKKKFCTNRSDYDEQEKEVKITFPVDVGLDVQYKEKGFNFIWPNPDDVERQLRNGNEIFYEYNDKKQIKYKYVTKRRDNVLMLKKIENNN